MRHDERKQVLMISSEFPPGPGGIGTHAYQIARHAQQLGTDLAVLCPSRGDMNLVKEFDRSQPFPVSRFVSERARGGAVISRVALTYKSCRRWRPDCILASGRQGVLVSYPVASALRIPWVAVGHGGEFTIGDAVTRKLFRMAFSRADACIAVSKYTRDLMLECGVNPSRVNVINNGADTDMFTGAVDCEEIRARLNLRGKRVILTVGSVTERKAQDVVISALPEILRDIHNVVYLVVGQPVKTEEYARLADRLGVSESVRFLGTVPAEDLPGYYALADVVALTSRIDRQGEFEGFGIALAEAGLMRKPVVGTRLCGIEDVIVDGETGFLVQMNSTKETAKAILRILMDKEIAAKMGHSGRRRALANFTWERCAEQTLSVLENLMPRSNGGGRLRLNTSAS